MPAGLTCSFGMVAGCGVGGESRRADLSERTKRPEAGTQPVGNRDTIHLPGRCKST
ncbi:hypothetical protein FTUN_8919 [Frigoriglobus tundricola]|uniref:Uncharacterized protein n=1 Tax=Frigoriglobus tundricola TaxID=2774151 RepID=A0A6M5Z5Z6_9BACT|nr:hypothetical protein FTUN_8919 [Frigoriglobus tundricola]